MAVEHLTLQKFKEQIFDYENEKEWKYKGDIPAVVDFYADWCNPCKMIAPIMEKLSEKYEGKVKIWKLDTEAERELAAMFGIRNIPSVLFIPKDRTPMMQIGALPEHVYVEIIEKELLGNKEGENNEENA
jgi:thioredoxin